MRRYSPQRRGYGGRGRSPPPPPRRGYGGRGRSPPSPPPPPPRRGYGGRKGSSGGSLLVHNIPLDCRPEQLRVPFERFGPVRDVYIPRDYNSGEPRGFAFVEFVDAYDAGEALRRMNKTVFAGGEITVVVATDTRKKPEEMHVKNRTRSREPSGTRGHSHGRSRSRSPSFSRYRPSNSRSRDRSRSYSPAARRRRADHSASPRRRQRRADHSASPRRRQKERPRSPARDPPLGEEDGKTVAGHKSPGYEGASALDKDRNGDNEMKQKPSYEQEEKPRDGRVVSRSRSRSVEVSPT